MATRHWSSGDMRCRLSALPVSMWTQLMTPGNSLPSASSAGVMAAAPATLSPHRLDPPVGRGLDQFGEELLGLQIGGVDHRAGHAPGEQYLVDVADMPVVLQVGDRPLLEVRVFVGLPYGDDTAVAGHQVGAEDDARPVVLESLGRVDAADLVEAAVHGGPEGAGRGGADGPVALYVPRPGPIADAYVADKRAVGARIAPRPAVSGRYPCRIAFPKFAAQDVFHFPRRLSERDLEMFVTSPGFGSTRLEAEQPQHPLFVLPAAAAPELLVERNVMDAKPQRRRV